MPAHVQYTKSLCGAAMYRIARGFKIAKNRIFLEVSNLQKKLHSLSDFRSPKAALNWDEGRMRQTMTLEHERKTAQLSNPIDICLRDAIAFFDCPTANSCEWCAATGVSDRGRVCTEGGSSHGYVLSLGTSTVV